MTASCSAARQRLERAARGVRLAGVREHRLAQRREQAVVEERRLVGRAPQPLGQEAAVAVQELLRPLRLVLIERLGASPGSQMSCSLKSV